MQVEVLPHRQFGIEREALRHVADALARFHVAGIDLAAIEARAALGQFQKPGQDLHRRGLAAAVRPEEAEDLARLNAEADVVNCGEVAEADGQILGLDHRAVHSFALARRDDQFMMAGAPFLGQKRDEGRVEILRAGLGQQVGGTAGGQHPPFVHRHEVIEVRSFLHVGAGHDQAHAGATSTDAADQRPELPPRQRIDACGRLVEDQQVGFVDQRAAQAQFLLHAARQLGRRAVGEGVEIGRLKQVGDPAVPFRPAFAEKAPEELHVLAHRKRRVEVPPQTLWHVGDTWADARPVAGARHVALQDLKPPFLKLAGPRNQRKQAGLPRPVRADQPDDAACRKIKRHPIKCCDPAVAKRQAVGPHDGGGRRHSRTRPSASAGQGAAGSSRTQVTPGRPVLV